MKIARLACVAAFLTMIGTAAEAVTFNYSYDFGTGDSLTGTVTGAVQGDANTIVISAVGTTALNGNTFPAGVDLLFSNNGAIAGSGVATFDGSLVNFAVLNALFTQGMNLNSTVVLGGLAAYGLPAGFGSSTGHAEQFNRANWSIAVASVPLPGSLLLLMTAMGGLVAVGRGRAA